MAITDRFTDARERRTARHTARQERAQLVRELSAYSTAERHEIEMLMRNSDAADTADVQDIFTTLSMDEDSRSLARI